MSEAADTIVAASSPPGRSIRAMVRISGNLTATIISALTDMRLVDARQMTQCRLRLAHNQTTEKQNLSLPAWCVFFAGPKSYTAQDMAEIQCPGHPALLERLIHACMGCGARLAEPGEFTFRAFMAGKLDLTEAEGIAATITAASDSQLQAATLLREGALSRFATELVDLLAQQLALVEAGVDFVDQEDVVPIGPTKLDDNLAKIEFRLNDLLLHSRSWGALDALPRIVLVGLPGTGKSTLFNALLNRRRAVTSPMAGTTRDVLAEPLTLTAADNRQVEVMLIDIAGLDTPEGTLDRQAQAAARAAIRGGDLILAVEDQREIKPPFDLGGQAAGTTSIRIRSKADLGSISDSYDVVVSAHHNAGLDDLRRAILRDISDLGVSISAQTMALQPRHQSALRQATERLKATRQMLATQRNARNIDAIELVADTLRDGLDQLAALGGKMTADDIIGRVFATFCIGK